jgi:hypothetical protein
VIADDDGKEVKQFTNHNVVAEQRKDGGFVPNIAIIPLAGILMPKFGEFSMMLFGDNQLLASIPIYCIQANAPA